MLKDIYQPHTNLIRFLYITPHVIALGQIHGIEKQLQKSSAEEHAFQQSRAMAQQSDIQGIQKDDLSDFLKKKWPAYFVPVLKNF